MEGFGGGRACAALKTDNLSLLPGMNLTDINNTLGVQHDDEKESTLSLHLNKRNGLAWARRPLDWRFLNMMRKFEFENTLLSESSTRFFHKKPEHLVGNLKVGPQVFPTKTNVSITDDTAMGNSCNKCSLHVTQIIRKQKNLKSLQIHSMSHSSISATYDWLQHADSTKVQTFSLKSQQLAT
eukprot:1160610-Pelagomonas_calceolata.AAC.18